MNRRSKTLKFSRRIISYKITYNASKKFFKPEITAVSDYSKCDISELPDLNKLVPITEAMQNTTKKIVEHIIGKKPDLNLYECLDLLSEKTDRIYVWNFAVREYFSYVGNVNNKNRRLLGYL